MLVRPLTARRPAERTTGARRYGVIETLPALVHPATGNQSLWMQDLANPTDPALVVRD